MKKWLKILLLVFLIIILLLVLAFIYFWFFFTMTAPQGVCIINETEDSEISCETDEICYSLIENEFKKQFSGMIGDEAILEDEFAREFVERLSRELIREIVTCDKTCKTKKIYDIDLSKDESCKENEELFSVKLKGKEIIRLFLAESKKS